MTPIGSLNRKLPKNNFLRSSKYIILFDNWVMNAKLHKHTALANQNGYNWLARTSGMQAMPPNLHHGLHHEARLPGRSYWRDINVFFKQWQNKALPHTISPPFFGGDQKTFDNFHSGSKWSSKPNTNWHISDLVCPSMNSVPKMGMSLPSRPWSNFTSMASFSDS